MSWARTHDLPLIKRMLYPLSHSEISIKYRQIPNDLSSNSSFEPVAHILNLTQPRHERLKFMTSQSQTKCSNHWAKSVWESSMYYVYDKNWINKKKKKKRSHHYSEIPINYRQALIRKLLCCHKELSVQGEESFVDCKQNLPSSLLITDSSNRTLFSVSLSPEIFKSLNFFTSIWYMRIFITRIKINQEKKILQNIVRVPGFLLRSMDWGSLSGILRIPDWTLEVLESTPSLSNLFRLSKEKNIQ